VKRAGRAVLGGTFDHLHLGHESLLETAFQVGRTVAIGLTTEQYLAAHPKPDGGRLQPYPTRRGTLTAWLRKHHPHAPWRIVPLDDPFGGSVAPGVGVLVVSADTVQGGRAVNRERARRGLPRVPVVVVPLALADDLIPIASRRIRAGIVDRAGRRLSPIEFRVHAAAAADRSVVLRAIDRRFRSAQVKFGAGPLRPREDLLLEVQRRRRGGWRVALRSHALALTPVVIEGTAPGALAHGVDTLLHPRPR
jgi:pantetheine-phosphate adenylyltransferase